MLSDTHDITMKTETVEQAVLMLPDLNTSFEPINYFQSNINGRNNNERATMYLYIFYFVFLYIIYHEYISLRYFTKTYKKKYIQKYLVVELDY